MEHSFWRERWEDGRTAFHEVEGNALLKEHWPVLVARHAARRVDTRSRVLVPLCGKTNDLTWLRRFGHDVVGVEFVESAAVAYFAERGVTPRRFERGGAICYEHDGVSIWVTDFFAVTPEHTGTFDLIYDRAALVAIALDERQRYIDRLALLGNPGAGLFLISFEHDFDSGPPFSAHGARDWMAPAFELERLVAHDILDSEPRFKERGATYMIEVAWFGTRKA